MGTRNALLKNCACSVTWTVPSVPSTYVASGQVDGAHPFVTGSMVRLRGS